MPPPCADVAAGRARLAAQPRRPHPRAARRSERNVERTENMKTAPSSLTKIIATALEARQRARPMPCAALHDHEQHALLAVVAFTPAEVTP